MTAPSIATALRDVDKPAPVQSGCSKGILGPGPWDRSFPMSNSKSVRLARTNPKRSVRANTAVAEAIGRRIVGGEFPVGTILPNEAAWGQQLGVSRSVVREAIRTLSAKGLVASRPRIGCRVEPRQRWNLLDHDVLNWYADTPDSTAFLMSLQQFRRIFEPEAAALAARFRSEVQMEKITTACQKMGSAPDMATRSVADAEFHLAILTASGNEFLVPLGSAIDQALRNMFVRINHAAGRLRHAQELHEAIAEAIRTRDPATARSAVLALLDNSDAMILQFDVDRFVTADKKVAALA